MQIHLIPVLHSQSWQETNLKCDLQPQRKGLESAGGLFQCSQNLALFLHLNYHRVTTSTR